MSDWSRPVVHWAISARDPEKQKAFYAALFNWEIEDGPIMDIPAGIGGPEPGPGGFRVWASCSRASEKSTLLCWTRWRRSF